MAANHRSYLDPPLLGFTLFRPAVFISKPIGNSYTPCRLFFKAIRVITLRPGGTRGLVLKEALARLREGLAVVIFPEGTRNLTQRFMLPGNPGVALLAEASGAPVIPVYIDGTYRALPRRALIFRPRPVHVVYGAPIFFAGNYRAFTRRVMEAIAALSKETGGQRRGEARYP